MTTERIRNWRLRAEELRAVAEAMKDDVARDGILSGAASYDKMADEAEARLERGHGGRQP